MVVHLSEQQIASVNELVFPADTPVSFKITSDAAMNSFFIPQLGGQIYAMAGMQTQLHLIANEPGTYKGFSANYSGAGFSGMKFNAVATKTPAEFDAWVAKAKASGQALDAPAYLKLLKPSETTRWNTTRRPRRTCSRLCCTSTWPAVRRWLKATTPSS
ncbi:Ubiquinol oxidase subunit 2 precursor [Chromobacterium violaceum]|uniref:Ubiquinol oxidase subunit 2 n=1 Tax=Chromobacterium violaceum TaxID=536 RepID=A0A447TK78_CHRVL|nr:Ubiquinol oxidase subunit 2 precursor [Chromobacterium violaceum]